MFFFKNFYSICRYVCFTHVSSLLITFIYPDRSVYFHEPFFLLIFPWINPKNLFGHYALVSFLLSIYLDFAAIYCRLSEKTMRTKGDVLVCNYRQTRFE